MQEKIARHRCRGGLYRVRCEGKRLSAGLSTQHEVFDGLSDTVIIIHAGDMVGQCF